MKQVFHKLFFVWEYEKEVKWLNDMAAKGFGLCHVGLCTYWFEDIEPGEYTYHLELAENLPSSSGGREYLEFLSECGAEYVGSYLRWIYLRRKADEGPFELHADLDSKIAHLKRILLLIVPILVLNLWNFIYNLYFGLKHNFDANILVSIIPLLVSALLIYAVARIGSQIRKLKKERRLHE